VIPERILLYLRTTADALNRNSEVKKSFALILQTFNNKDYTFQPVNTSEPKIVLTTVRQE